MKKISLKSVTAALTRDEMRQIMAGSDPNGCQRCVGNSGELINCMNDSGTCYCPGTAGHGACHQ